jgi:hypothetical protein
MPVSCLNVKNNQCFNSVLISRNQKELSLSVGPNVQSKVWFRPPAIHPAQGSFAEFHSCPHFFESAL